MKHNRCVLAATFKLGSWSIAFTHWEVYRARAINMQLCGKAQLRGGRPGPFYHVNGISVYLG